jgi:hypothetical protein
MHGCAGSLLLEALAVNMLYNTCISQRPLAAYSTHVIFKESYLFKYVSEERSTTLACRVSRHLTHRGIRKSLCEL